MNGKERFKVLLEFIPDGKGNAISQRELATLLKCDVRDVRAFVQDARIYGIPICSTQNGYFMSDDPDEIEECYRFFNQRHETTQKVMNTIWKHWFHAKKNGRSHV